jgi:hypothetical protein
MVTVVEVGLLDQCHVVHAADILAFRLAVWVSRGVANPHENQDSQSSSASLMFGSSDSLGSY